MSIKGMYREAAEAKASTPLQISNQSENKIKIEEIGHNKAYSKCPFCFSPREAENYDKTYQIEAAKLQTILYLPNWLHDEEEKLILQQIYLIPKSSPQWVHLRTRRLQVWGGDVQLNYTPAPLPDWLNTIVYALVYQCKIFPPEYTPNHVLINEYMPGEGILPHQDGPKYYPLVVILSLNGSAQMTFRRHRSLQDSTAPEVHFPVDRRSLLIFKHDAYTKYLHSIDEVHENTRVSLTIRHVYQL